MLLIIKEKIKYINKLITLVVHEQDLPSSAKLPNAMRHISVRAAFW